MINQTRPFLLFALFVVGYLLWIEWQRDYAPPPPERTPAAAVESAATVAPIPADDDSVPLARSEAGTAAAPAATPPIEGAAPAAASSAAELVRVRTDLLDLAIDLEGASIVRADLLAYPAALHADQPVRLLSDAAADFHVAQSGLVSANAAAPSHKAHFQSDQVEYRLAPGADALVVDFHWRDASGVAVVKRYTFHRGSYVVELEQRIENGSAQAWNGNAYRQLQRVAPPAPSNSVFGFADPTRYSFTGAAWYDAANKFQKRKFDKLAGEPLAISARDGWITLLQPYFLSAWIPHAGETDRFETAVLDRGGKPSYLIRATSPAISIEPGAVGTSEAELFIGPKVPDILAGVAPDFKLAVDYGKLRVLSEPLHWVLAKLHGLVGNWGVAIILLVLIIKAVFYKLSEAQYRSMAKMRKLAPRIQALKERFGDDKAKMQQAMMDLYKQEKANPAAGCLPMLVQIPVFFALYWMLMQSVELRQAPFFGWIQDLSAPDPYFILPIIYGLVMLGTSFLMPTAGMDPTQAKIQKAMPVIFSVMFALFPAGLVLYYCVNGLVSLIQQWVITRRYETAEVAKS